MKIATAFAPYEKPTNALPIRCHVLKPENVQSVEDYLTGILPWCYTSKEHIQDRIIQTNLTATELIKNKLPDPGSVMSGDFGEIVTLYFLSSENADKLTKIKKWRYKQDRKKAAPHSDVVLFHRERDDRPSSNDYIICAEVKQRATRSDSDPIKSAVEGSNKDSVGRLARTLTWLKEQAIDKENREAIDFISRFTLTDSSSIQYVKKFKAVAVIDRTLLDEEITKALQLPAQNEAFEVIALGIENLKSLYEKVFQRAAAEISVE